MTFYEPLGPALQFGGDLLHQTGDSSIKCQFIELVWHIFVVLFWKLRCIEIPYFVYHIILTRTTTDVMTDL